MAEFRHGAGSATCADDILIIGNRLTIKLYQATLCTLTQVEFYRMILIHFIRIRDILRRSRHIFKCHQFFYLMPAGDTFHLHIILRMLNLCKH